MPWETRGIVDQRWEFIEELEREEETFSELCRRFGISRQTGYKWKDRYAENGREGLKDQSRAPRHPGRSMEEAVRQRLLELRAAHPLWGPIKLKAYLAEREPEMQWPAASSIGHLLAREGLVHVRKRRKRTPPYGAPLAHADVPNRVWSADFKGWFICGNGERCDPLTIEDAHSRFLLRCRAVPKTDGEQARRVFEAVFREYGMPIAIRTDNGAPFASPAPAGLSRLAVWWLKLGVQHERIDPGCPQQNGRHERMHLTLKQSTANPPKSSIGKQQEAFMRFEQEYNWERPHQALENCTPGAIYRPSSRTFPCRLPGEVQCPEGCHIKRLVSHNGYFSWKKSKVFVSEVLGGEYIGFLESDDGLYEVYFGPVFLGWFDALQPAFVADRGGLKKRRFLKQ